MHILARSTVEMSRNSQIDYDDGKRVSSAEHGR